MPSAFEQLDDLLADESVLWEEESEGSEEAAARFAGFDDAAWISLEEAWRHRPSIWQERLARRLDLAADTRRAADLLVDICRTAADDDVALAAADGLRCIDRRHVHIDAATARRLRSLVTGPVSETVIGRLLDGRRGLSSTW